MAHWGRQLEPTDEQLDGNHWRDERAKDGNTAFHFDAGKPRVDLIPAAPILKIGEVFGYGCKKYGDRNWEEYASEWTYGKLLGSLERHLLQFKGGQDLDAESGHHHLDHLMCDAVMLRALILAGKSTDDRSKL